MSDDKTLGVFPVPPGWKLVPVNLPTAMQQAGVQGLRDPYWPSGSYAQAFAVWNAFLAAAPEPPEVHAIFNDQRGAERSSTPEHRHGPGVAGENPAAQSTEVASAGRGHPTNTPSMSSSWTPLTRRLPAEGSVVLAFWTPAKGGMVNADCFGVATFVRPGHWHNPDDDEDDYRDPTHWMPLLPPAPETPSPRREEGGT